MPPAVAGVTVSVNVTFEPRFTFVAEGETVRVVGAFFITCAKLLASIEPSPVTWSYPAPALNPYWKGAVLGQPVEFCVHGTILLPDVTSWNGLGVFPGKEYRV
jgi:hypothetical protein